MTRHVTRLCGSFVPQLNEWKALFKFHAEHETADSLPTLPVDLMDGEAPGSDAFKLTGMPIAWKELWLKLAGRFPRPHHAAAEGIMADARPQGSSAADDVARNAGASAATPQLPLPLHNSVTGINYQPAARQQAGTQHRRRLAVGEMPMHAAAADILPGHLYFIVLPKFEGEMCVGVGRVKEKLGAGEFLKVEWLARPGWSNTPSKKTAFFWEATSTFRAARSGFRGRGRQITSTEPLAAFLPVPVELTSQSATYDASLPLLHAQQQKNLRITKQCISMLREFSALRWPDLIRTGEQAVANSQDTLPPSEASAALTGHRQGAADIEKDAGEVNVDAEDKYFAKGGSRKEGEIEVDSSEKKQEKADSEEEEEEEVDSSSSEEEEKEEEVDSSEEECKARRSQKRSQSESQPSISGTPSSASHSVQNPQRPKRSRTAINRFS
eukprot:4362435-Pleurochrysis_carterae.AAC.2